MGQTPSGQSIRSSEFSLVREVPIGTIMREEANGRLHFVKEFSFNTQEAYQQAFVNYSKKLPEKHQHILSLQRTATKVENTFCSTFYKISLVYEYLEHNLKREIQQRAIQRKVFDEKEVWSVLCSCALAMTEIVRMEGRSHSALRAKDVRLTKEGVVKILALEMVGLDYDQEGKDEGATKTLAMTILHCLLMEEVRNESQEVLEQTIEQIDCTGEMKNILLLMIHPSTKFIELEEYLFKLVQEDTDSLASYSNTPILNEKTKVTKQPFSRRKLNDSLETVAYDSQDTPQTLVIQYETQQAEAPDESFGGEDEEESCRQETLRQKEIKMCKQMLNKRAEEAEEQFSLKGLKVENREKAFSSIPAQGIFTDPSLLNLIQSDLQEIKKRKSFHSSQVFEPIQAIKDTKITSQSFKILKNSDTNIKESLPSSSLKQPQEQKVNVRPVAKQNMKQQQKAVPQSNPQSGMQIRIPPQCTYDNIMLNEDMGFRKAKAGKHEQSNQYSSISSSLQESQRSVSSKQLRNEYELSENSANFSLSKNTSNRSSAGFQTIHLKKQAHNIDDRRPQQRESPPFAESPSGQLEYVNQTYLRGRYEGTKLAGMRHGKGVFHYNEGGKYIGTWRQNKMHGKGVLYYPNNQIAYEGDWKNDQLCGHGTLYNEEVLPLSTPFNYRDWAEVDEYWMKYEGGFVNDNKEGMGKLFLSNGELFEGVFRADMVWGQGTLLRKDGTRVKGLWRENKLTKVY